MKSNYVCAGFETLATILNNFENGKSGRFDNHFTKEQISSDFFPNTCNMFLHSFGQNFAGRKRPEGHMKSELRTFEFCRNTQFFNDSKFIMDSGGFQASIGRIDRHETQILIDLYHRFLVEHSDVYDRAFTLDLPPGPECKLFKNWTELYDRNEETYNLAANMPDHIRNKMIYVHHFRTPKLWDTFTRLMRDNNFFDKFQYHATGGIVANMATDSAIPCIIYVIPMIPLINEAMKCGRNFLNFHILGGANFRDILFYELFKIHLQKKFAFEVEITYDSSGLFKALMVGRYISVIDNGMLTKLDLRTKSLNVRHIGPMKRIDKFKATMKELSDKYNFKDISPLITEKGIYCGDSGTFFDEIRVYSMLYMLHNFADMQTYLSVEAARIYPLYEAGELQDFVKEVEQVTRNLNQGKITRKQKAKSVSIVKSLDMLSSLDENYCKFLVDKVLAKDEFQNLEQERVMTF